LHDESDLDVPEIAQALRDVVVEVGALFLMPRNGVNSDASFASGGWGATVIPLSVRPTASARARCGRWCAARTADGGFIVIRGDGRGTPGREWERAIHKDLVRVALEDQSAILQSTAAVKRELDRTHSP
jgi:hypothetical protein